MLMPGSDKRASTSAACCLLIPPTHCYQARRSQYIYLTRLLQLLEHDDGRHCAIAPLLELQEHRRHPDSGVWCAFACVGAARISDVELRTVAEEQTLRGVQLNAADEETMLVASATLLREEDDSMSTVDYDSADDEGAFG